MAALPTAPGFGLEEMGIPGKGVLREALTNCSDPLKAIEEFQVMRDASFFGNLL